MKQAIITYSVIGLMLTGSSFATDWNLSGDSCGIVNTTDLILFCEGWLDPYDLEDFAAFASEWGSETNRYYCNDQSPVASNGSAAAIQYEPTEIVFTATDDGLPRPPEHLKYRITQLPEHGYIQNKLVRAADQFTAVPAWCTGWANSVFFGSDTTGDHTIQFMAFDGDAWSDAATLTVTVSACAYDSISLGPDASVSIPDGTYLDAADGWGIDFWIKTRQENCTFITKRSGGAGYEISLVNGYPQIVFYDGSTSITATGTYLPVNTGQWVEVGFTFNISGSDVTVTVQVEGATQFFETSGSYSALTNSEAVVISDIWNLDSLRYYSGITSPGDPGSLIQGWYQRTDTSESSSMGFFKSPSVWFLCDEGTGTTITDSKTSQVGTFSGDVYWYNAYWDWDKNGNQTIVTGD